MRVQIYVSGYSFCYDLQLNLLILSFNFT